MMTPIYVEADTKELLRALALPGENFDALLRRLALEVVELRRERAAAAPPEPAPARGLGAAADALVVASQAAATAEP